MRCPLCDANLHGTSFETARRPRQTFWRCGSCDLVTKDPGDHVSPEEERRIYELHENGGEGHRAFLRPVADAVARLVPPGARGLDWGAGPVPLLSKMLAERGFSVETYDPHFGPRDVPPGEFDFVTLTEVIEHFREPRRDLERVRGSLAPGGRLFVYTSPHPGGAPDELAAFFENWGYRGDPTHVSFFGERTFAAIAGFAVAERENRLTVLRKLVP